MLSYHRERGFDCDEATCSIDLITDLLHHLHALGEDPFGSIEKAKAYFDAEARGSAPQITR